jgi:hypothetical protein
MENAIVAASTMRIVLFVVGILLIAYGALLVGVSMPSHPLILVVPVPWSSTPATINNPQLEPGAVLILFGAIICIAAIMA